ncbi:hypothetical protein [Candidatus Sarmatiella mevalonica]|uniref:hypothetical protein n=1 Tax=Candidatus Sarmatiella mevalonica TaxID=2770581 RepID=UPI001920F5B0|nr:hypothetical protein [Candidatus Sarmatiella mevalonica]
MLCVHGNSACANSNQVLVDHQDVNSNQRFISPLSKLTHDEQMQGSYKAQSRSVHEVREDSCIGAMKQCHEERKRSIDNKTKLEEIVYNAMLSEFICLLQNGYFINAQKYLENLERVAQDVHVSIEKVKNCLASKDEWSAIAMDENFGSDMQQLMQDVYQHFREKLFLEIGVHVHKCSWHSSD